MVALMEQPEPREMVWTSKARRLFRGTYPVLVLSLASAAPAPARADFLDDARRTFQTDIPHFFQDDIPCAFGGQPTSHTKTSCKPSSRPPQHSAGKDKQRTTGKSQ